MPVQEGDISTITHINFVCKEIHDKTTDLYESLMDRDNDEAKKNIQEMMKYLSELSQSLSDEI